MTEHHDGFQWRIDVENGSAVLREADDMIFADGSIVLVKGVGSERPIVGAFADGAWTSVIRQPKVCGHG